jgi:hypothetical protein
MNRKILRLVEVVILVSIILFFRIGYAQNFERVIAYEALSVSSTEVKTLTADTYTTAAVKALVTLEGPGNIRFTLDGTAPTTGENGVGHLWVFSANGVLVTTVPVLWLGPHELRNFKAIGTSPYDDDVSVDAAEKSATIRVTYFAKP